MLQDLEEIYRNNLNKPNYCVGHCCHTGCLLYILEEKPSCLGFIHHGFLDINQFTGGKLHKIKSGLITFLQKSKGIPLEDKWQFIFIIPDDLTTLKCPVPKNATLQTLPLYSARVVRPNTFFRGGGIPRLLPEKGMSLVIMHSSYFLLASPFLYLCISYYTLASHCHCHV